MLILLILTLYGTFDISLQWWLLICLKFFSIFSKDFFWKTPSYWPNLITVKPLNSGHLRVLKNSSVIERWPLLRGNLKKIVIFRTKRFVRYSCYVRYLGCPLLGGFTVVLIICLATIISYYHLVSLHEKSRGHCLVAASEWLCKNICKSSIPSLGPLSLLQVIAQTLFGCTCCYHVRTRHFRVW